MATMSRKGGSVRHTRPNYVKRLVSSFSNPPDIAVGFPIGKATSVQYPDGTPVIDVAVYNNYGTFNEDGSVHIPPRPFLDIGGLRAVEETKIMRKTLLQKVREGQMSMEQAADMIGAKAAAVMKNTIRDLNVPPNAPSTIARKKSDNPLVDTGLMMQTVTWDVRKKNNRG